MQFAYITARILATFVTCLLTDVGPISESVMNIYAGGQVLIGTSCLATEHFKTSSGRLPWVL